MANESAGDAAGPVRELLAKELAGVLSTISIHCAGYPYGSLTPYALDRAGQPLLLLSNLAAHTKNLIADARASLFVGDSAASADPQAGPRATLLGRALRVAAADVPDARDRYVARWPQGDGYLRMSDFGLWLLRVEEIRLVAGFGEIRWLPGSTLFAGER